MKKTIALTLSTLLITTLLIGFFLKIETHYNCCESPTVRWKFALYCGECDDETGCHFTKIEGTGWMEYFGIKKMDCALED